jgi:hypothetical protein
VLKRCERDGLETSAATSEKGTTRTRILAGGLGVAGFECSEMARRVVAVLRTVVGGIRNNSLLACLIPR